jgi:orotate phosphoribosyltransferase
MAEPIGATAARLLFECGAVAVSHGRPFILAAGWASPVYIDCRLLIGTPRTARAVTDLAVRCIDEWIGRARFDCIAGAETAGIPFAAWIADRLSCDLRYVRRRPLGIGRGAQVEGGAMEDRRALLVDDLATDAGSKVAFVRGLREAGATVEDALVIFFNGAIPGATERLAGLGLKLHAMATWQDMLASGLLPAADQKLVEQFLADPTGWSMIHGGRTAKPD